LHTHLLSRNPNQLSFDLERGLTDLFPRFEKLLQMEGNIEKRRAELANFPNFNVYAIFAKLTSDEYIISKHLCQKLKEIFNINVKLKQLNLIGRFITDDYKMQFRYLEPPCSNYQLPDVQPDLSASSLRIRCRCLRPLEA